MDSPVLLGNIERFLSNPILWGIITVVAIALGLSGKFSVTASSVLMWVACAMASFGVYRIFVYFGFDPILRALGTVGCICVLAIASLLVVRWINGRPLIDLPTPTKNEVNASVQLSITCDNVALPMAYHGDLWILNTAMLRSGGGLAKLMPPPKKPEGLWPEEGVRGIGYRCTVKNHGTQAAFSVSFPVTISELNLIRTGETWTTGGVKETHSMTAWIPQPLGQQGSDQFSFYVCSYDSDGPFDVTLPSTAFVNSDDPKSKREVSVKVTSIAGNPFTVPPKEIAHRNPSAIQPPSNTALEIASPNVVVVPGKSGMFLYSDLSGSYLYVKMTLENKGAFVRVQTFLGNLLTPDADLPLSPSSILDGYNWVKKDGSVVYTFHTDKDSLEEKAARGIATGARITGWLKFDLGTARVQREQFPLVKLVVKAKYESGELSNAIVVGGSSSPADVSTLLTQP